MKLLIANGHVVDPSQGQNSGKKLLIEDESIYLIEQHNAAYSFESLEG